MRETQTEKKDIHIRSVLVTIILIVVGLGLFAFAEWAPFLGPDDSWQRDVAASIGVFFIGVLVLGWLDDKLRMEKHFSQFRRLLSDEIRKVDTVQSKCLKLGIEKLFETRSAFDLDYSFAELTDLAKPKSRILCVARSLFHFLNKEAEIKAGLEKGIQFDLVCLNPTEATGQMCQLVHLYPGDIQSALNSLDSIANWAQEHQPEGGIELRYHQLYLPDSGLAIETEDGDVLIWDLSFGRDLTRKRIVMLNPQPGNLGQDLLERYHAIWNASECKFRIQKGTVQVNQVTQST
jgi:hypothetical protein